jgi:hypothetical protein
MRLCFLITILVTLVCCWVTPAQPEPVLYLPSLVKPTTMPTHGATTAPVERGEADDAF